MKSIRLLRDHTEGSVEYRAGQVIEVSDEHYKWLVDYYLRLRQEEVKSDAKSAELLKKAGVLNDATSG